MSEFSMFMKANKRTRSNEKYAPTMNLVDENGNPLEWEFRAVTSKENDAIMEACITEVQVTGKPGQFRPKVNSSKYAAKMIVASTVYPDLYNAELQDSYGVKTPEDLLLEMVDNIGEYQELAAWVQKFQGFAKSFDEKVDEAKN